MTVSSTGWRPTPVALSDIRDPGRWLLGVALPQGCGYQDCEAGIIWRTGAVRELCAETVQDRYAARQREKSLEQAYAPSMAPGLVHPGTAPTASWKSRSGARGPARVPVPLEPVGPQPTSCAGCGCVVLQTGRAVDTGLYRLCREEADALAAPSVPGTCSGRDGETLCARRALPTRSVCFTHRSQELAGEVERWARHSSPAA
ncbi:hypothetical protein ACFCYC_34780 [Streptomyces sp. NPDC056402]|uniref:hypothetical protein n=1 Tax=Streptomyces sp. NPDC056402 TaxID=3345810 RepID=UPI0035DA3591